MSSSDPTPIPPALTPDEWAWLRGLANVIRHFGMAIDADRLDAFAAKLAALLPPDPEAR